MRFPVGPVDVPLWSPRRCALPIVRPGDQGLRVGLLDLRGEVQVTGTVPDRPPEKPRFSFLDRVECLEYLLKGQLEECPHHQEAVRYRDAKRELKEHRNRSPP